MPTLNISRSKVIQAPIAHIYDIVSDMSQWEAWSPWLIMDPKADVKVREDKQFYSWEGPRVGAGEMQVARTEENKSVDYDLMFLKPWKSKAKVKMELNTVADGTKVTWHMDSSLPFFLFWMKKMTEAFIASDYDRGLNLLKDYAEKGSIPSQLNHIGRNDYPGCNYLGTKRTCSFDDMPKHMEADFTALMQYAMEQESMRPQDAFTIYHKWDMVKGVCTYTAGVPYDSLPDNPPSTYFKNSIPSTPVYTLEHVGPYDHLGNAWSTLYTMQRVKEIKVNKKVHPFETYGNSPKDTAPEDLIARIHFPVK